MPPVTENRTPCRERMTNPTDGLKTSIGRSTAAARRAIISANSPRVTAVTSSTSPGVGAKRQVDGDGHRGAQHDRRARSGGGDAEVEGGGRRRGADEDPTGRADDGAEAQAVGDPGAHRGRGLLDDDVAGFGGPQHERPVGLGRAHRDLPVGRPPFGADEGGDVERTGGDRVGHRGGERDHADAADSLERRPVDGERDHAGVARTDDPGHGAVAEDGPRAERPGERPGRQADPQVAGQGRRTAVHGRPQDDDPGPIAGRRRAARGHGERPEVGDLHHHLGRRPGHDVVVGHEEVEGDPVDVLVGADGGPADDDA